jgi:hypothetical protein
MLFAVWRIGQRRSHIIRQQKAPAAAGAFAGNAIRCGSVSRGQRGSTEVEQIVDPYGHQLDIAIMSGEYVAGNDGERGRNRERGAIQPNIIVFNPRRPIIGESPLNAATSRPPSIGVVVCERHRGAGRHVRQGEIVAADPCAAALAIDQRSINRVAQSTRQRGEPAAVIAARNGLAKSGDRGGVVVVGKPIKVAFDTGNEVAAELVVDTYLAAADECGVVIGAPIHAEQAVGHVAVGPPNAKVATEIEPGPTKRRRDRSGRRLNRHAEVGSHRGTGDQGADCNKTENRFLHGHSP